MQKPNSFTIVTIYRILGYYKRLSPKTKIFITTVYINCTRWGLLENGDLAIFTTKRTYKEYPAIENTYFLRDMDVGYFRSENIHDEEITDTWNIMTDEDILLLDYKKRDIRQRYTRHDEFTIEDSSCIRSNNYILTGKKGNGCIRKINSLLEKYNL